MYAKKSIFCYCNFRFSSENSKTIIYIKELKFQKSYKDLIILHKGSMVITPNLTMRIFTNDHELGILKHE